MDFLSSQTFWTAVGAIATAFTCIWVVYKHIKEIDKSRKDNQLKNDNLLISKNESLIKVNRVKLDGLVQEYLQQEQWLRNHFFSPPDNGGNSTGFFYSYCPSSGQPHIFMHFPKISSSYFVSYNDNFKQLEQAYLDIQQQKIKVYETINNNPKHIPKEMNLFDCLKRYGFDQLLTVLTRINTLIDENIKYLEEIKQVGEL